MKEIEEIKKDLEDLKNFLLVILPEGLQGYINENHNGKVAAFAKAFGVTRQAVYKWLADGDVIVWDGVLYTPKARLLGVEK